MTPRGELIVTRYDPIGRVVDVRVNGSITERFTYDTVVGAHLRSRLAAVVVALCIALFGYDARGRVTARGFESMSPFTYLVTYDAADR